MDPAQSVHERLVAALRSGELPGREDAVLPEGLSAAALVEMFHSQVLSRQLDRTSRALQARGEGFYTIGSSGHEGMAAVAAAFRPGDMAFLHYRDAAFQIQRSKQVPGQTPAWDMLLSFAASAEDPISGGRHKVLGSKALNIPPQTSTIASHLPKAMGAAYGIGLARDLDVPGRPMADDAVVMCSFGDASANHSTAQGAINAAAWTAFQGGRMPIVWVCEDNGIGISVRTPRGWIAANFSARPALRYVACDGLDLIETWRAAREAVGHARRTRRPVFLHMRCVRLYGHAGSDVQAAYMTREEIEATEAGDPLLHSAGLLARLGALSPAEALDIYEETGATLARIAEEAITRPKLTTAAQVAASLIPPKRAPTPPVSRSARATLPSSPLMGEVARSVGGGGAPTPPVPSSARATLPSSPSMGEVARSAGGGGSEELTGDSGAPTPPVPSSARATLPIKGREGREEGMDKPQHLARLINWALADLMLEHGEIVLAGEDIGPKGGVYNVTAKLSARFGPRRVINTLLDEQSILGLAIGLAHNGLIPIPEIQFLAYVHNAEDQIRGEASTLSFFSNGQYTNPMIVRVAGLGYQKGFGGHFHNDNSVAVLRDIPGLIIACPSNGADAVAMLRECVRLAREEQRLIVFLEPIALYMTRDLHAEKDGLWTFPYAAPGAGEAISAGQVGVSGEGADLAIVSYANGYYLSRQAAKILADKHGVDARVIDLRWLAPVDFAALTAAIGPCGRVLIVDECRITGSISEALMAGLAEHAGGLEVARLAAEDCFIPLGRAATVTLPSRDTILAAALSLAGAGRKRKRA